MKATDSNYRTLIAGDKLQWDDEFKRQSGEWKPTARRPGTVLTDRSARANKYRRKVTAPQQEPSYRTLKVGEILQPGDEYESFFTGGWTPTSCPGLTVQLVEENKYRRKVAAPLPADVGEGYRSLKVGEKIQAGDEFRGPSGQWQLAQYSVGEEVWNVVNPYRRKVTADVGEGYRALEVGELVERGDDYWYENRLWLAIGTVAHAATVNKGQQYRRRKNLPGYRLLAEGEIVGHGDEVWMAYANRWEATIRAGSVLGPGICYRRKITPSALQVGEVKAADYLVPIFYKRQEGYRASDYTGDVKITKFSLAPTPSVLPGPKLWALIHDSQPFPVVNTAASFDALEKAVIARNGKDVAWHLANGFRVAQVRQSFTVEAELATLKEGAK